jgi:uncharacterized coiled-coil protein SlyX
MSAVPKWRSIRQQVLDDARWGTGEAHLEPTEVPQWIAEAGDEDVIATLSAALTEVEGKDNAKLCALLDLLCERGEDLALSKVDDLLEMLRTALTNHCIRQAQKMVDAELVS